MKVPINTMICVCAQRIISLMKFLESENIIVELNSNNEFTDGFDGVYDLIPAIHKHDERFFITDERGLDVYRDVMNVVSVYSNYPDIFKESLKHAGINIVMDS